MSCAIKKGVRKEEVDVLGVWEILGLEGGGDLGEEGNTEPPKAAEEKNQC